MIPILFEDDALIVVDKPAGVLSVADRQGNDAIADHLGRQVKLDEPLRIVHRLDADTSGVMMLAKAVDAQRSLTQQFEQRQIDKTYLALVHGVPESAGGRVNQPLIVNTDKPERVRVAKKPGQGKPAVTEWTCVEQFGSIALIRCKPLTGRQHQIRVHLASIGLPLLVDPLYGGRDGFMLSSVKLRYRSKANRPERPLLGRLSLHAESIAFTHPVTTERVRFEASLPKDFNATLNQLRKLELP